MIDIITQDEAGAAKATTPAGQRLIEAVRGLNDIYAHLANIEFCQGNGALLAAELRAQLPDIVRHKETIDCFRCMARAQGKNPDIILRAVGCLPDFSDFGELIF